RFLNIALVLALLAGAIPILLLPGCSYPGPPVATRAPRRQNSIDPTYTLGHRAEPEYATPEDSSPQTTCPAINFQRAQEIVTGDGPAIQFGLQRVYDGSFTEYKYSANTDTQTITKTGSTPNAQQNYITCAGLGSRPLKPGAPNLKADPLGS